MANKPSVPQSFERFSNAINDDDQSVTFNLMSGSMAGSRIKGVENTTRRRPGRFDDDALDIDSLDSI